MARWTLIALCLGLLLVTAPFTRPASAEDEYDEDGDDDDDAAAAPAADATPSSVVDLTSKNWDDKVKKSKYALVAFTAPWCGHCKTLKPNYEKAATSIKAYNPDIIIGMVDATAETELGTKFEVSGYPTLKWFVDGELASDYNGGRDEEGIVNWVKKKTGPPAVTVEDADKLKDMEKDYTFIVVGYFKAFEGKAYDAFKSVAAKLEDVIVVQTTNAAAAKVAGLTKVDTVAAIKNFKGEGRQVVSLTGDLNSEDLKTFITAEKLPLSIEFTSENSDKIFNSGIPKQIIVWGKAADFEADSKVFKLLHKVSAKNKGKLVFVTVNNEGDAHEPVTNFFGLKDEKSPQVIGFWMEKNKKYRMKEDLNEKNLEAFSTSVYDGTALSDYKSAPIPEDDKDESVQIVVGKSFDSIVLDPTKDVLLEVYAPWCGHCKKLDPIYKKLAKRFKKVDSVVIAKMDGTENEHPEIEVKGFPTIFFFPAEKDKKAVSFEGERTLAGFTKFIKQQAKVAYELPKKGSDEDSKDDKKTDQGSSDATDEMTKDEL